MPMALRRVTAGTYDPVLGVTTGGASSDIPCLGILTRITDDYAKSFAVEANDRMAVLDGAVTPMLTDLLLISGVPWAIVRIEPVEPTTTPLAYRLQVRS